MADASGLTLVPPEKRNPLHTTTFGLGELILAAMDHGCPIFIISIGGSATNDCSLSMLTALASPSKGRQQSQHHGLVISLVASSMA